MTEKTKPTAPGSFAKLMATPPPAQPTRIDSLPAPSATDNRQATLPTEHVGGGDNALPQPNGRTGDLSVRTDRLLDQIPPIPAKRRPERYAFQFYTDQITRLEKLKQVLNIDTVGLDDCEEITLSDLVREAVDDYLAKQIQQISQGVRTDE